MQKKYFLEQLGCAKNQVDGETILFALNENSYVQCDDPASADFIIINSCGFIESAKQESINTVLEYKKQFPDKKIILAGCLAKRYEQDLAASLPEADLLFCENDLFKIAAYAERLYSTKHSGGLFREGAGDMPPSLRALSADIANNENRLSKDINCNTAKRASEASPRKNIGNRPLLSFMGSAYIKISEGCNNRCTFCAIPVIRGNLISRTIADISSEARILVERGVKELCLVAQDAAAYGMDIAGRCLLDDLLQELSHIDGDFWVRLLYLHPDHFPLEILQTINSDKRYVPYFDIPFQHASETLLNAMNRRGNSKKYLQLIKTIRNNVDNAVMRSTFLTGFPGESEKDFAELLEFQANAELDWAGVFTYSKEDGTPAFSLKNTVPKITAKTRKNMLLEKQAEITPARLDRFIGIKTKCLIEEEIDGADCTKGDSENSGKIQENDTADSAGSIFLGRLFCHAPEVDGAAVICCDDARQRLKCGSFIDVEVFARANFDFQVRPN
ncbi:MAG: 30S ribosomal protein S12 methylthiotransferase RimO [Termitinemataceae bacterium]|nr:MAG: 30S ribosomal protein S12 methylthiotransferase RimO [Termitinemataceae bacterium]